MAARASSDSRATAPCRATATTSAGSTRSPVNSIVAVCITAIRSHRRARTATYPCARVLRLVTIPISHYCEKARWALERAGIPYREERHVQIVHRVASRRAGGGGTVPVLVAPEGVFAQSADILAYADGHTAPATRLYPEAPRLHAEVVALERDFDADLGPEGRR